MSLPGTGAPPAAPAVAFNADMEITKVEAKQFALLMGELGLMLCVCTTAMCLLRPRAKQNAFYVDSEDEEEVDGSRTQTSGSR